MVATNNILACGSLTLTTSYQQLDSSTQGFRWLLLRVEDEAAGNVEIGLLDTGGTVQDALYLKTDESLTFPNVGTIRPSDIYLKGTADDVVQWIGVKA